MHGADHLVDTRQNTAVKLTKEVVQIVNVAVEESIEVFCTRLNPELLEKIPDDRRIGASGKIQPAGPVGHAELGGANAGKGFFAGTAALNQGPVDVEQHESNHSGREQ